MALTLTLKNGDKVAVGNAVIQARGRGRIKLTIDAPKEVRILREKLIGTPAKK